MQNSKNDINQIIRNRCSTQPFNFQVGVKIDDSVINEILETAIWAPTHGLTQPWIFKVFHQKGVALFFNTLKSIYLKTTPAEKQNASKISKFDDKAAQVSHVIAICMIRDKNHKYPEIEEIVATGCVIENIYLCLDAYSIAGYLSTGDVCYSQELKDFLGLGNEDVCLGFFQLGIPKTDMHKPNRKRIPALEKTTWIDAAE